LSFTHPGIKVFDIASKINELQILAEFVRFAINERNLQQLSGIQSQETMKDRALKEKRGK
jgi:mannitol/fructose-specific phosphotransferase system IIA component (Ntr-type)